MSRRRTPLAEAQTEMSFDDKVEHSRMTLPWAKVMHACKTWARDPDGGGCVKAVAFELDRIFAGGCGHITDALLNNCFGERNGNYFRAEWLPWFCENSQDVAEALAEMSGARAPKAKSAEQLVADFEAELSYLGDAGRDILRRARLR